MSSSDSSESSDSTVSSDSSGESFKFSESESEMSSDMSILPPPSKKLKKNFMEEETELNYEHVIQSKLRWKIENFNQILSVQKCGDKIESPIFSIGSFDHELKWRLLLYPKGISRLSKNQTAAYLHLVSNTELKTKVSYEFSFFNSKSKVASTKKKDDIFMQGQSYGNKEVMNTNFLKLKFIANDKFIFQADLTIHLNRTDTSKIQVTNKIKIINYLEDLLEQGDYSDGELKVENNVFKIHKCILAARSPVFAAMFEHDMIEKAKNCIEVKDVSKSVMKEILRFAYTGDVENLDEIAKDLLAAANKFLFEDLKIICENALFRNVKVDNVVEILSFAEMHNATKLKEYALDYFVRNVKGVIETSSFKKMGSSQTALLQQVICKMASKSGYSKNPFN